MSTFDTIVIAFSFIACVCIGRMNILLIGNRSVSLFSILVANILLLGGIILLDNEIVSIWEEIVIAITLFLLYFSLFTFVRVIPYQRII